MLIRDCALWYDIEAKIAHPLDRAIVWHELRRVYNHLGPDYMWPNKILFLAFNWAQTPQGNDFWRNVYYGRVDTSTIRRR